MTILTVMVITGYYLVLSNFNMKNDNTCYKLLFFVQYFHIRIKIELVHCVKSMRCTLFVLFCLFPVVQAANGVVVSVYLVLGVAIFIVLIPYVYICCRGCSRRDNDTEDGANTSNATSMVAISVFTITDVPPPSYENFVPPSYETLFPESKNVGVPVTSSQQNRF